MEHTVINLQFTDDEAEMILKYMEVSEAVSVEIAILNAVSLALDYVD